MAHDGLSGHAYGLSREDREGFLGIDLLDFDNGRGPVENKNTQEVDSSDRYRRFKHEMYNWDNFTPEDYVVVPLTKGYFAVVSPEDFDRVSKHKWCANEQVDKETGRVIKVYAYRRSPIHERKRGAPNIIYLHRFLKGVVRAGHLVVVDHLTGDSLDCRRCNLLVTDQTGNHGNRSFYVRPVNGDTRRGVKPIKKKKNGEVRVTGYKGRICVRGKDIYSKTVFTCSDRAHRWYVRMHKLLHPVACSWRNREEVPKLVLPITIDQALVESIPF